VVGATVECLRATIALAPIALVPAVAAVPILRGRWILGRLRRLVLGLQPCFVLLHAQLVRLVDLDLVHRVVASDLRRLADRGRAVARSVDGTVPGDAVAAARIELDKEGVAIQKKLECGTPSAVPACDVTVRYLYQVLRGLPPEQVFAQILTGFELASADSRVVGLNLVMPEDWYVPMRDFNLHMRMLDYLHGIYPKVHISLHAGELAMGLVPPEGLSFHIRHSIELGHAERIGHGVAVMDEHNALDLMREMAERKVLVEICLTSNDVILGVKGDQHPLPVYLRYNVPVALATDDEGVSRSDMTHEYLRAAETYNLSYVDLKHMARQSLDHSFLPGASLWADSQQTRTVTACASDHVASSTQSAGCNRFLNSNEKASLQWKLERDFITFENKF